MIRRAERANFKALVVTVDTALLGRRLVNERNGFDLPSHLKLVPTYDFVIRNLIHTNRVGLETSTI